MFVAQSNEFCLTQNGAITRFQCNVSIELTKFIKCSFSETNKPHLRGRVYYRQIKL